MKNISYFIVILFTGIIYCQPKDILVDWECNMEVEILSGRFDPGVDIVTVRGDFNAWGSFELTVDPTNPDNYVSPYSLIFSQLEVGDTVVTYKFFYTPNTWEIDPDKIYILTQADYDSGFATISRPFNNLTLSTITNQETIIKYEVDCNDAISFINGLPFPVINTVRLAGGIYPLQWPGAGWPDSDLGLTLPMYDDGTHGDIVPGDLIFTTEVTFPPYTAFDIVYKYSINYGDPVNNGGGNDNEAGYEDNHNIQLSEYLSSATVENVFGTMGFHDLINEVYVPVDLTSFTALLSVNEIVLRWQTASETNNRGFEVERKMNQNRWERIGFIEGNGTTTEIQAYEYTDNISTIPANSFTYRLKQIDYDGSFEYSNEVNVLKSLNPNKYILLQNYPNPFNPGTKIKYSVPQTSQVQIKVFDVLGNEIKTLVKEEKPAGTYEITWNAAELPSGVYFYQLKTESYVETRKMILMK